MQTVSTNGKFDAAKIFSERREFIARFFTASAGVRSDLSDIPLSGMGKEGVISLMRADVWM